MREGSEEGGIQTRCVQRCVPASRHRLRLCDVTLGRDASGHPISEQTGIPDSDGRQGGSEGGSPQVRHVTRHVSATLRCDATPSGLAICSKHVMSAREDNFPGNTGSTAHSACVVVSPDSFTHVTRASH